MHDRVYFSSREILRSSTRYVRLHRRPARITDGLRHIKLQSQQGHGGAAAKVSKVIRRRVGRVQMQHRLHRRMLCRLLQQHADAGALCAVLFAADSSGQRKMYSCWALRRHTNTAQHAHARTAQRAPVASMDSLYMTTVEHIAHTHAAAAAAAATL